VAPSSFPTGSWVLGSHGSPKGFFGSPRGVGRDEARLPALGVVKSLELDIDWLVLPSGEEGLRQHGDKWAQVCKEAIDACDTTWFGSASGKTPAIAHLRWGKGTYANVRPVRYMPGARSPLAHPEGIDFVIVRENLEDMYSGVEGDLEALAGLGFTNRQTGAPLPPSGGKFAVKVITEANTRRIVDYACRLALQRKKQGYPGRLAVSCKYNVLRETDGLFRRIAREVADGYPELQHEDFIADDFARRIVAEPHRLDVVVLPNLYGDIFSDEASALVGGLGVAPSGCYGDDYAYFESVHGTAPDIAGRHVINPTATLLSAAMMLRHLGLDEDADALEAAIAAVYAEGRALTPDQGGTAHTEEFCEAVRAKL
jgi:isocitrate/isopropylmalate dehydrogenase